MSGHRIRTWTVRLEEYPDGDVDAAIFEDGKLIAEGRAIADGTDLPAARLRTLAIVMAAMRAEEEEV